MNLPYPNITRVDWAFEQGFQSGLKNDLAERGTMRFCIGFAATSTDELNAKNWLNGFAAGQEQAVVPTPQSDWRTPKPSLYA